MNRRDAIKIIAAAPIVSPIASIAQADEWVCPASLPPEQQPIYNPASEGLKSLQLFFSPADKSVRCAINGAPYNGKARVRNGDFFNNVTFVDGRMVNAAFMFDETFAKSITGIDLDWNDFVLNWNLAPISGEPQSLGICHDAEVTEDFRSTFASQYEEV